MRLRHILIFLSFMVMGVSLIAQKLPNLSVISLNPVNLDKSVAQTITGLLEVSLGKTRAFHLIMQEEQKRLINAREASLLNCTDENCAIRLGQILSVEQILMGVLSQSNQKFMLYIKIIDVSTGKILNAEKAEASSLISLIGKIDLLAYKLAGDNILARNPGESNESNNPEKQLKKESLLNEKKQLGKLAKIKSIVLPVTIGASVAGFALSGVFWYLSEDAYTRYANATTTSLAEQERRNVQFYDTAKWTAAGSTLVCLGVTLVISIPDTSTTTIDQQLTALGHELGTINK